MRYTTPEAIARLLRGRLALTPAGNFGPSQVDPALIEQIGLQVEAKIDSQLKKIYRLPLRLNHAVLESICEKGVICELLGVHSVTPEQGNGGAGQSYRDQSCAQYSAELKALLSGAVELEGEAFVGGDEIANPVLFTQAADRISGKEVQF